MEFLILDNSEIIFDPPLSTDNVLRQVRRSSKALEVELLTRTTVDGANNKTYSKKLASALMQNHLCHNSRGSSLDWKIELDLALPNPTYGQPLPAGGLVSPRTQWDTSFVKIYAINDRSESFFASLHDAFNKDKDNATFHIRINSFGLKEGSDGGIPSVTWKFECYIKEERGFGFWETTFDERFLMAWKNDQQFCGRISISLILSSSALSLLDKMSIAPDSRFTDLKRMLTEEICSDLEIIVGHGFCQTIRCHRAILAAASDVFRAMFESGMREATENMVKIKDISEEGVRAMLAYLYYRCTEKLHESSESCLEALRAAHKYNLTSFKETISEIMMTREATWFGMDTALNLYIFTREVAKDEEIQDEDDEVKMTNGQIDQNDEGKKDQDDMWNLLKIRSFKVLKWYGMKKRKTPMESAKYTAIFSRDPKLAMEITSAVIHLK